MLKLFMKETHLILNRFYSFEVSEEAQRMSWASSIYCVGNDKCATCPSPIFNLLNHVATAVLILRSLNKWQTAQLPSVK